MDASWILLDAPGHLCMQPSDAASPSWRVSRSVARLWRIRRASVVSRIAHLSLQKYEEDNDLRVQREFRRKYRVPWSVFKALLHKCRYEWGLDASSVNRARANCAPLELKLLCALRMLGRGSSAEDDIDHTDISVTEIRKWFHRFTKAMRQNMVELWCSEPKTPDEIAAVVSEYERLGFPGCIGSCDVVHIAWDRCPAKLRSFYKGGNQGYPTLGFEVTATHSRRIIAVTAGYAGTLNDKTIVCYDGFVQEIHNQVLYEGIEFELCTANGQTITQKGLYLICDGGYHHWRCLQCPRPHASDADTKAWSYQLTSVRKDVEARSHIHRRPPPSRTHPPWLALHCPPAAVIK